VVAFDLGFARDECCFDQRIQAYDYYRRNQMGLDIRLPIGGMFVFVGILMTIFGAIRPQSSMSVGINVNLIWGVVLLIFGAFMYLLGRRGARTIRNAPATTAKSEPVASRRH
jgi:hypothetical protein